VATVQREGADRIVAAPGSKTYGAFSVGVQVRAETRIAFRVGRQAFRPVPAVDSAAIVMDRRADALSAAAFADVRRLTRAAFGQRRKQLQKILRSASELGLSADSVDAVLEQTGLDGQMRPEQLSPQQFVSLAATIAGSAERQH
jgi:16S rRNA (adenine1518-N6/adenine1519-N6)-dimethyltransferase